MKTIDKLLQQTLMALLLAAAPLFALAETQVLDRIAAIVDDDIILASEIEERLEQVRFNLQRAGQQIPEQELRRELLDVMIVESLQLQMADRVGLRISDEQLNAAMARIAAQNNMSLSEFQRALDESGASYTAAREQIRMEMVLQQVQRGNVNQRIQITSQEVDNYLESEEGRQRTAPEYRFAHVLVQVPSDASAAVRERAERQAEEIARQLRQGANPESLSRGDAVRASDLGWRKRGDLPSLFAELPDRMNDGDVSDPISSASGFHVVKLLSSRGHKEVITQTRARHILINPSAIRTVEQTRRLGEEIRRRSREGESFNDLARRYSEDIGSAQEGGDLGWISPGQLVPEFEEVMNRTEIGEVSAPFESQFGWHVLKVEDRRQQDVTRDLRRQMARSILHERKFNDELEIWLRNIRDEAFVDIKL